MRRKRARFLLLVIVLALTAQLFLAAPATAQGAKLNPAAAAQIGIPYNRACARRCRRAYRRCLRRGRNPRACYVRLRNCLRRCPQ